LRRGKKTESTPGNQGDDGHDYKRRTRVAGEMISRPDELVAVMAAVVPRVSLSGDTREDAGQDDDPESEHREEGRQVCAHA